MENILQSIVKIIIIGLYTTYVEGNRQFLPPPLPYFQNENFYIPTFGLPYRDPQPVFYRAQNIPPSFSYQNLNSYTPPQLFHQNEHYHPEHFPNNNLRYSVPQIIPQKPNLYEPYKPQHNNFVPPHQVYKKTPAVQAPPAEAPPKKPGFYTTNIVVKEESHPSYYQDDYKNYHEDDYIDNYSDESPSPADPCIPVSPYRYFEMRKVNPTNQKLTLCNPQFQPHFPNENGVYTVKMPITLLPSRFPPRVEELIQRIQNYFSTYTEKETPKPHNETSTTIQPGTEAVSFESATQPTETMEQFKRNKTAEIEELSLEETKPVEIQTVRPLEIQTIKPVEIQTLKPTEMQTVKPASEAVTQKTIVVVVDQQEPEQSKEAKPETESKHVAAVTGTQPTAAVPETQSAAAVPETQQAAAVSETQPAAAATETQPVAAVTESKPVAAVTEPSQAISISISTLEPKIASEVTTEKLEEQTFTSPVESVSTALEGKTEEAPTSQPTSETLPKVTDTND